MLDELKRCAYCGDYDAVFLQLSRWLEGFDNNNVAHWEALMSLTSHLYKLDVGIAEALAERTSFFPGRFEGHLRARASSLVERVQRWIGAQEEILILRDRSGESYWTRLVAPYTGLQIMDRLGMALPEPIKSRMWLNDINEFTIQERWVSGYKGGVRNCIRCEWLYVSYLLSGRTPEALELWTLCSCEERNHMATGAIRAGVGQVEHRESMLENSVRQRLEAQLKCR